MQTLQLSPEMHRRIVELARKNSTTPTVLLEEWLTHAEAQSTPQRFDTIDRMGDELYNQGEGPLA